MTGAGREVALEALVRAGAVCTDNLPASLLGALTASRRTAPAVVTIDARQGTGLAALDLRIAAPVLFLDAADDLLVQRLHETTVPHPCCDAGNGAAAVAAERRLLAPLRAIAQVVVDTGALSAAEIGERVVAAVAPDGVPGRDTGLHCTVSSFGFKHGPQTEADWVIDVRFLPNPFWEPALRPLTGLDAGVSAYVFGGGDGRELVERCGATLRWVAERSAVQGRRRLHVAVGCTGGRHRSVAVAEALAGWLRDHEVPVDVRHRDVALPDPR